MILFYCVTESVNSGNSLNEGEPFSRADRQNGLLFTPGQDSEVACFVHLPVPDGCSLQAFGLKTMSSPRPLSDEERRLTRWMIEHGDVEPANYLFQLENAVVISQCKCGCASIDFQIGSTLPNIKTGMKIIADYLYGPENPPFGVFVFTRDDVLAGLEVYSFSDTPAPLPAPGDLRPFG